MDNELLLFDRIEVIKQTIAKYGEDNFYISFSGGKDSTVLHHLVDLALPNNKIPRVFINTGIEYNAIVQFVKDLAEHDDRIVMLKPSKPIKETLENVGYPFKSKEHAKKVYEYQKLNGREIPQYMKQYIEGTRSKKYCCPAMLQYQFTPQFDMKVSHLCCDQLKKQPAKKWAKQAKKSVCVTGMRAEEGGARVQLGCIITDKKGRLKKFNPLIKVTDDFENWFIERQGIRLCSLYYEPYNFDRTGCKGCPFSLTLQEQLETMQRYLPNERKQCELIWQPVYAEYRRLGYRLEKEEQLKLF